MGCPQGDSGFVLEFLEAQSNFGSGPSSCYFAREVQFQSVSHSVCQTLCNPMDCSPPVSSVQGISRTRILKWVAISFSRGSSPPRGQTQVPCIADGFFTVGATMEVQVQFSLKPSAVTDLALFEMTQRKP